MDCGVWQLVVNTRSSVMTAEKGEAVQWYKKGIAILEKGIAVEITGQGMTNTNMQMNMIFFA